MANDTFERMVNSEVAYSILRNLSEEPMYAKELSEEIGSSRNSIANYLNMLRDSGLIERGKRTKAQYYKIRPDGFFDVLIKFLEDKQEENGIEGLETLLQNSEIDIDLEDSNYGLESLKNDRVKEFLIFYCSRYIETVETSTIRKMLIERLHSGLQFATTDLDSEEIDSEFRQDLWALKRYLSLNYLDPISENAVQEAVNEINEGIKAQKKE